LAIQSKICPNTIITGSIPYFSATWIQLGLDYDWITNPDTGYQYDVSKHWTEVEDIDLKAGDIKYVWEKSRISRFFVPAHILLGKRNTGSPCFAKYYKILENLYSSYQSQLIRTIVLSYCVTAIG